MTSKALARWQPYPAYKDSGAEWLGAIPKHWRIDKLKRISAVAFSSVDKHSLEGEIPVRLCNYVDVYKNDVITHDIELMVATATPSEKARFGLRKDDVLITKDSEEWTDIAVPAYVCSDMEDVVCGYHLAHIRPCRGITDGKYLSRSFRAHGICDQFRVESTGVTRFGLGKYSLDNSLFVVPPIEEQKCIATFLDAETARIDALIEKKQRQIALLQEKRATLISHAVTKGLNPNARMKDSGIDWLGQIPEHWSVRRLKYVASWNDEVISETTDPDLEILYVDIGNVDRNAGIQAKEKLRFEAAPSRARRKVRNGDVIVSTVRTYLRAIAPIVQPETNLIVSTGFAVIRPKDILDQQFASYALRAPYFVETIVARSVGVSYPAINATDISNLFVSFPPVSEQRAIAAFLYRESLRVDLLIGKIQESTVLLQEYRGNIISVAVTGKIDVRGEAA